MSYVNFTNINHTSQDDITYFLKIRSQTRKINKVQMSKTLCTVLKSEWDLQ